MFRNRNLVGVGIAVVMLVLMTGWAFAQPVQQGTATPEPTTSPIATATPEPTQMATSVAPTVSPPATPIGTPNTLPTTGGSDDGTAAFSLLLMAVGAVILIGVLGLTVSRRSR